MRDAGKREKEIEEGWRCTCANDEKDRGEGETKKQRKRKREAGGTERWKEKEGELNVR